MRRIHLAHLTPNLNSTGREALQNRVSDELGERCTRLPIVKNPLGWGGRVKMFPLKIAFYVPEKELYLHVIHQRTQNILR